ncbi:M48 family metallopeptidase [Vibrio mediterranei]|jgi:predicted Zn-dependent protease|uniref:Zn-dependent protease n=1 Tax=Vibrio mediterranei TaxID=689 RepID=A0ABX5D7G1_9VIBR|nr:M48 family metallopeptidase [Vibrio mediterranei]MCG9628163.1 M48 family metallopeptidase [Vibrio mediterranei]MCG9658661.1 M48 family metallopeptidase [Vibrio mediterranei]MCG9662704.1 M48 family metallopeptidase [Vibrio mediterranei]NOI22719.1 M48 family metallopeptidase [Vibrio mediterranei]PCD88320.1 Zn-dependent protease [Vibrio mediterranei]
MKTWTKAYCLAAITSVIAACSSSPTGRNQLILFSDAQMSQLGAQSFEQMKKEQKVSTDKEVNAYVQCVAKTITDHVPPQPEFSEWEVVVFDSDQVNAFALPGGKIGVYTGLLNVAVTPDQLATVIGHEVAHVLADHSNERLSQSQLANTGLQITNVALGGSQYRDVTMAALGVGVQYGVILPYGRTQESEADIVGLELMAKSGFDPNQSVELWKNMAKASGGSQPPELLSTHPSHDTRISDLRAKAATLPNYDTIKPNCK